MVKNDTAFYRFAIEPRSGRFVREEKISGAVLGIGATVVAIVVWSIIFAIV